MNRTRLFERAWKKPKRAEYLARYVGRDYDVYLPLLIEGISAENGHEKNLSCRTLKIISTENPRLLYPFLDAFYKHIHDEENLVAWTSINILANMSFVDVEDKVSECIPALLDKAHHNSLVIAGHAVEGLFAIARAKPEKSAAIHDSLMLLEEEVRDDPDEQQVIIGKMLDGFLANLNFDNRFLMIEEFALRHQKSLRAATRVKASRLLKKLKKI